MFGDDLILFGVASEPEIQVAMSILSKFCAASGQKINMDKSNIIFFVNTPPTTRRLLTSKVSLKETTSLGNHLGMPIIGRSLILNILAILLTKSNTNCLAKKVIICLLEEELPWPKQLLKLFPLTI